MKTKIILLFSIYLLSGCASILNTRYQKVTIDTKKNEQVFIDEKELMKKNGKYLIKRDRKPKQITIKKDETKDRNFVIMQYKKSPLYIISFIPFGILLYPPYLDHGHKSWNYDKEIQIPEETYSVFKKASNMKEIKINKVSFDLNQTNIKYRNYSTYKSYIRNKDKDKVKAITSDDKEKIEIEKTIFSEALNELLKEKGYIDTTKKVLKGSYLNNLLINATIKDYTLSHVSNEILPAFGFVSYDTKEGMLYVNLKIEWEIMDFYNKVIYTQISNSTSGQFAIMDYNKKEKVLQKVIKDGLEVGLLEFMNSNKVQSYLINNSQQEKENAFEEIKISAPKTYVSNLSQAVKSTVTIKSENNFGSGFIISNDGFIISNYHVVSDSNKIEVITNEGLIFEAEVVRVSKIYDLALIKIKADNLIPFNIIDKIEILMGTDVYAIGTPTAEDLSQTISKGIISGIRNIENNSKLIQTDASVNFGNSGGPLILKTGQVLGVVNSKITGLGIEGVAFGIPAYEILNKLKIRFD